MKGNFSAVVFKVMAVVSALAIGGVYVGWRQMEADKSKKRERIAQAEAEEEKENRLLLSESKNPGENPGETGITRDMTREALLGCN